MVVNIPIAGDDHSPKLPTDFYKTELTSEVRTNNWILNLYFFSQDDLNWTMDTLTFTPTDNDTLMENDEFAFILKSDGKRLYILVQAVFKHSWTLIIHTLAPSIFFSPIHCFSPTSGLPRKLIFGMPTFFNICSRL